MIFYDLQFFIENPWQPAIAGFNYYVTSERYLDDNVNDYSPTLSGGNGRDIYVDTEAVRSGHMAGLKTLLTEARERNQIPLAVITECHLNCTREQQLRWLDQHWEIVRELNVASIPIVAITAWALLGAYDWNSLVTKKNDRYKHGAFMRNAGKATWTALAYLICAISNGNQYDPPVLSDKGYWYAKHGVSQNGKPIIIIGDLFPEDHCNHRFLTFVSTASAAVLHNLLISGAFTQNEITVLDGMGIL